MKKKNMYLMPENNQKCEGEDDYLEWIRNLSPDLQSFVFAVLGYEIAKAAMKAVFDVLLGEPMKKDGGEE